MNSIAFIFTQAPHGSSAGREGLDALLSTSGLIQNPENNIGVFFISDGVLQLLPRQKPEMILARNYIDTFGVLSLYDIKKCYICLNSLKRRGLKKCLNWVIDVKMLSADELRKRLADYDICLTF